VGPATEAAAQRRREPGGHHARRPLLRGLGNAVVGSRRREGGDPDGPAGDGGAVEAAGGPVLAVPGGTADGSGAGGDGRAVERLERGQGRLSAAARGLRRHWGPPGLVVLGAGRGRGGA